MPSSPAKSDVSRAAKRSVSPMKVRKPHRFHFQCINSIDEFESIESDWQRLTGNSPAMFQSFGWNRAWFEAYADTISEINLFILKKNGAIVALLPCYRENRRIRLAGDTLCDFQDLISQTPDDAEQFMIELFAHAKREDLHFHFHQLSERGNLWPLIKIYANSTGFDYYAKIIGPCPWFEMKEDGEAFLTSAKAKLRKRIRRALRRLEDLAPEHHYKLLDHSQITASTINDIADLHEKNQHRKEGTSIFANPSYKSFILQASQAPDTGIHIIEVRTKTGELIAFDLGFHSKARFYAYLGSYDEAYSGGSPGVCLLQWQMEQLPLLEINEYDFLCGSESYKFDYAPESYKIMSVKLYSYGFANSLRLTAYRYARRLKVALKPLFAQMGILK